LPKPLPSYAPLIEEEFMLTVDWKTKNRGDEKLMKRKAKKIEKDAIRELKKDTQTIQDQRMKEKEWRRTKGNKMTVKIGQLKDEI